MTMVNHWYKTLVLKLNTLAAALSGTTAESYDGWQKVPEDEKEIMWRKWVRVFRILKGTEGRARKWTMQQLGISLRRWRVEMNRDYVKTGFQPFEKFGNIT